MLEEFEELTPGEFLELCKRRNVAIKYDRYANALSASAIYNVNRASTDDPVVTAFDFVRDEKAAAKREKVRQAKRFITQAIGTMPFGTPREKFLDIRRKVIGDLTASGHGNAEALFDECWPTLKPTKEEL